MTWPTTRFGSSIPLVVRMSCLSTRYFAAKASSVSFGVTVTTRPVTGGIVSVWPMCRSFLFLRSFAHQTVIIETSNLDAIPTSVSPGLTL